MPSVPQPAPDARGALLVVVLVAEALSARALTWVQIFGRWWSPNIENEARPGYGRWIYANGGCVALGARRQVV